MLAGPVDYLEWADFRDGTPGPPDYPHEWNDHDLSQGPGDFKAPSIDFTTSCSSSSTDDETRSKRPRAWLTRPPRSYERYMAQVRAGQVDEESPSEEVVAPRHVLVVKVTMVPHTEREDEFFFYKGQTKIVTEKSDWQELDHMGEVIWAYYGENTTYVSMEKIG
jgi:hypothetical protein